MRLNISYLRIIQILHPRYHPKIIKHIQKYKQKSKRVYIHDITRLIIIEMKINLKSRSHRYDIYPAGNYMFKVNSRNKLEQDVKYVQS